jgi:hypothetical protein
MRTCGCGESNPDMDWLSTSRLCQLGYNRISRELFGAGKKKAARFGFPMGGSSA